MYPPYDFMNLNLPYPLKQQKINKTKTLNYNFFIADNFNSVWQILLVSFISFLIKEGSVTQRSLYQHRTR